MDSSREQELIVRAKRGDVDAFEAILAPALEIAYRYACALLHEPNLAEDAVQEACVRAWQKLHRVRAGRQFQPWFLGIVNKQCRELMRNRWWNVIRAPRVEVPASELPEEAAMRRARLRQAVGALSERERQILILRIYLDLSWADVAAVTGLSEAGARTRYYRTLGRFPFSRGTQEVMT